MESVRLTLTEEELRQLIRRCCSAKSDNDLNVLLSAIGKLCAALERINHNPPPGLHKLLAPASWETEKGETSEP